MITRVAFELFGLRSASEWRHTFPGLLWHAYAMHLLKFLRESAMALRPVAPLLNGGEIECTRVLFAHLFGFDFVGACAQPPAVTGSQFAIPGCIALFSVVFR